MVISWQVIGGIVGASLVMVGIGVRVLGMTPPDFRAGRGWFLAAALWVMVWSAAAYLATDRSSQGALILATVEIATVGLLLRGLRWTNSRELRVPKPLRPLVRLEVRRDTHAPQHTYVVAMNDGDLAAINVTGECVFRTRDGDYAIKFGPVNVGVTPNPTLIPVTLFSGEHQIRSAALDRPPECEWTTINIHALLSSAQGETTGGEGIPFVSPRRPEPLACKFNVTYTDPVKHERYNRTHILRYSSGALRIDLDDAPDPADLTPA